MGVAILDLSDGHKYLLRGNEVFPQASSIKIAVLADTWGITIAPHLFPELNVHLLASIPNGIWCENMGLLDDVWIDLSTCQR